MIYSESFKFNIQCGCTRYTPFRFAWLNPLGGIDTYTFRLASTHVINSQKKEYQRYLSRWNESSQVYGYDIGDRGASVYDVQAFDVFTVVSTYQTEAEHQWLAELFSSQAVYLINYSFGASTYTPVIITSNSVTVRDKRGIGNRLLSHTIEFILANKKVVQRG